MGDHGCVIRGRGCAAVQAFGRLYEQQPLVAAVILLVLIVVVCAFVLWLLDLRGNAGWKPDLEYKPPQLNDRERRRE